MRNSAFSIAGYLALTLFCLCLFVPGLSTLPPLDRDEARFAQASKQMLETGDFVDIRFQDEPRHKKPVGIYWLQAAAVSIVGEAKTTIWPYRLPSVIGAWLATLLVFAAGTRLFDRRTALLGAGLTAGSLLLILEAHQAKTDAVLLATIVASQAVLARLYMRGRGGEADAEEQTNADPAPLGLAAVIAFWAAQGLAILVKGPIAPMVIALTVIALVVADRDWRWLRGLRPKLGVPLALAIALPWGIAVWFATDGAFYTGSVGADLLSKVASGQESHGAWPGYHALLMLAFFWPGSLYAWPALVHAWRSRTTPGVRFCLAWLVPAWLVFELTPTKLPHYVLPLYPALAMLTAYAVRGTAIGIITRLDATWVKALHGLWAALALVLGVAALALPMVLGGGFTAWSIIPFFAALAAVVVTLRLAWRGRAPAAAVSALLLGGALIATTLEWVMPRLSALWLSREAAAIVETAVPDRVGAVATAGFSEPSLVFLLGTDTRFTDGADAARHLAATPGAVAIVSDRHEEAFRATATELALSLKELGSTAGINYSKGDRLRLSAFQGGR